MNVQDKYGDTALHIASRLGNKPIAKQLLNFKADDSLMNQASVVHCRHLSIYGLLLSSCCDIIHAVLVWFSTGGKDSSGGCCRV